MILEVVISLLAVAGFAVALWRGRIVPVACDALKVTMAGFGAMTDSELDDAAKEVAVRRAGFGLIVAAFNIFWRFGLALAAAAAPIFLADASGLVSRDAVFELMLRWDYIIIVSVVAIVLSEIVRRRRASAGARISAVNRNSAADRFFHMLAFSSPFVLMAASSAEDRLLSSPTREASAPPIFITSLARGGTTALLNAFHDIPGIATHTYRDMPFLTAPTLWNHLAGGRKRSVARHQRAHGDGLEIDLDTPEAFEEVIWKMFWPEKYQGGAIGLWGANDRSAEAERFLARHMAKVIRAREIQGRGAAASMERYCSKNNANIARIPYLVEAFPGCRIIVPVRRPESHAASLLRQHENFLNLQAEDEFIRRYMRDIGHFEFGQIHKPIQFPGFEENRYEPVTGDYWLYYWIQAFQEILKHRESCMFVFQDDLRISPQKTMMNLCDDLALIPGALQFSDYFHPEPDSSSTNLYSQTLYREAAELYCDFVGLSSSNGNRPNRRGVS